MYSMVTMVRILSFHCCGLNSIPGLGTINKILQAVWCELIGRVQQCAF